MSEKVLKAMAVEALSDNVENVEFETSSISIRIGVRGLDVRRPLGNVSVDSLDRYRPVMRGSIINFPENRTDQSHALSIAELVKRGQGQTVDVHESDFDFPDGRDSGLNVNPLVSWNDPAENYEHEQTIAEIIQENLRKEAKRRKQQSVSKDVIRTKDDSDGELEDVSKSVVLPVSAEG